MCLRDNGDDVVAGAMASGSAPRSPPGTISCGTATSSWMEQLLLLLMLLLLIDFSGATWRLFQEKSSPRTQAFHWLVWVPSQEYKTRIETRRMGKWIFASDMDFR